MKTPWLFLSVFVINQIIPSTNISQNLKVYQIIGKKIDFVISKFGKPVHQDRSNPNMQCIFYKTKTSQSVFVSDNEGIFQAECSHYYDKKNSAKDELNIFIAKCKNEGYEIDTVNISEYNLNKPGVKVNVVLFENNFSQKYEIKVKANKSVGLK
ncbi:MAG: hypothetical protein WAR79_11005 [Melioribacteraceae bacterium]